MKTLSEKIAVMQAAERGDKIEGKCLYKEGSEYFLNESPKWDWNCFDYRVAREEPSIDWDAVATKFKWLVVNKNGKGVLFSTPPCKEDWEFKIGLSGDWASANSFASFRPGNIPWSEAKPIKRQEGK